MALAATVAVGAALAPVAQAGSYDVLSCSIDGGFYPNNAWNASNNPNGNAAYQDDVSCGRSNDPIGVSLAPNVAYANGTWAALWFFAPPQTLITNYKVSLRHDWYAPGNGGPDETTYQLASFGSIWYSGAGQFRSDWQGWLAGEGHWYGWVGNVPNGPVDSVDTGVITRTLADSPLARAHPTGDNMTLSAGCWNGAGCTLGPAAVVSLQIYGSRVTITDNTAPGLTGPIAGSGLLAPGTRSGDEPLTFSATDNVGIRKAEIVDVSDASRPSVVASADYNSTPTTQKTRCDFTRPRPCPDLKNQTLAAPTPIAGHRTVILRVTDAAGNQTVSAPFSIVARGPLNGSGGGDGARIVAGFPGHARRGHRRVGVLRPTKTVGWGHSASVRGILRNAAGQPIAGAQLHLLIRDLKLGSHYADRGTLSTGADGRFTFRIVRGASRRVRIAYRAYLGDDRLAAKTDLTFSTKARITVHVPRHVRSRGTVRFRGSLPGRPLPPHGVTLDLQAHQPGHGWRTVKTTRTRRGGRYSTRYRFNSAGGRFTFRLRLRPNDSYPFARGTSKTVRIRVG